MKVLQRGHRYELKNRGDSSTGTQVVQYINREPGMECDGVTQQEVLRMMIDRNRYCTSCLPNSVSERIQYHLRMALVLHEMRALERKVQKGELEPEYLELGEDGHFKLIHREGLLSYGEADLETPKLEPYRKEWELECNHQSANDKPKFQDLDKEDDKLYSDDTPKHLRNGNVPEDNTPGIILDTRESLERALSWKRKDKVKIDYNKSLERTLSIIYSKNMDSKPKIESLAKFCYSMYRKRVQGNQPLWGSDNLKNDPYYSGMRVRAYLDAMELVFDYVELNASYFRKNRNSASKDIFRIFDLKTGVVEYYKSLAYDTTNVRSSSITVWVEHEDSSADFQMQVGLNKTHRIFKSIG